MRKTPNGGFEIIPLKAAQSVTVCVQFNGLLFEDAYFKDRQNQAKIYVVELECAAPIDFGLYDREAWYRWVWCWESTAEADEALKRMPDDVDKALEQLVYKINAFIREAQEENARTQKDLFVLDVTDDMKSIGRDITIMPASKEEASKDLEIYKRLKARGASADVAACRTSTERR